MNIVNEKRHHLQILQSIKGQGATVKISIPINFTTWR